MRKLVEDNLIKVINTMSDTPYEEYNFTSTPMEGFQITQGGIDKDVDRMIITFEGKIEPYTQLSLTRIDSVVNVGAVRENGDYRIDLDLPEIITEPFEIYGNSYYDNQPEAITYRIFIPKKYENLPLCLAFNEKKIAVRQWSSYGDKYVLSFDKPEGYTSVEEGWAFGYKQGMFYLVLNSL